MKPLVGISCCNKVFGPNGLPNHAASDFCVRAVAELCDAVPVLLPALGGATQCNALLRRLDGILLTGSRTHIWPDYYGAASCLPQAPHDRGRDETTLPLVRAALMEGTPILAICRGMQEMNVALGGTLHQSLSMLDGRMNHQLAAPEDADGRTGNLHPATLTAGGVLHRLAGQKEVRVNSLHQQGVDRIGAGLQIEATALDGTVEAISVPSHRFALGVQWHPEFTARTDGLSAEIFRAFGRAAAGISALQVLAAD